MVIYEWPKEKPTSQPYHVLGVRGRRGVCTPVGNKCVLARLPLFLALHVFRTWWFGIIFRAL